MVHRSEDATVLLGMAGFVVGAQVLIEGEWWLHVQTDTARAACPECGTWARVHGRRRVKVRDLPISGRPVVLCWSKRIWRCVDSDCDKATWTETTDAVRPRAALSERARAEMCRRVGEDGDSVAEVARAFGVGWHTAMDAIRVHGRPLVDDPARTATTTAMGVDETVFLHANRSRHTTYVTGMVDLDRARLLDVVEGRSGKVLGDWLDGRSQVWRDQIAIAALDPFRGYATALRSRLPQATVVVDHFHAVRLLDPSGPLFRTVRPRRRTTVTEPATVDALDRHRQAAGLSHGELWLRYFELGGMSSALQLEAILYGALVPTDHDREVIAHALNERFAELGGDHPVAYSNPTSGEDDER